MKRCNWDGQKTGDTDVQNPLPPGGAADPFRYLPAEIAFTAPMAALADRYVANDIDWRYYPAFQAAAFLRPHSPAQHEARRRQFASLRHQVEAMGFQLPASLIRLVRNRPLRGPSPSQYHLASSPRGTMASARRAGKTAVSGLLRRARLLPLASVG